MRFDDCHKIYIYIYINVLECYKMAKTSYIYIFGSFEYTECVDSDLLLTITL